MTATNILEVDDAFLWLTRHSGEGPVFASLSGHDEMGLDIPGWIEWFGACVRLCAAHSSGPVVFAQTDRKGGGRWLPKDALVLDALDLTDHPLLWHKIILRRDAGKVDIHRPTYRHLLAFGPARPGKATPDVIPASGRSWSHGLEYAAADLVVTWFNEVAPTGPILNPFCGAGTVGDAAVRQGRDSIGCDLEDRWSS